MIKNLLIALLSLTILTSCFGSKFGFRGQLIDDNDSPVSNANIYFLSKKGDTVRTTVSNNSGHIAFEFGGSPKKASKITVRYVIEKDGFHTQYREEKISLIPDTLVLIREDER